jgi:polar amino acid transport system substrate-binding protein
LLNLVSRFHGKIHLVPLFHDRRARPSGAQAKQPVDWQMIVNVTTNKISRVSANILPVTLAITLSFLIILSPCFAIEKLPVSTGEWKPYTSAEIKGYGFFSEIVTAAFREAGLEITYGFYPWKRCEVYVKTGKSFAAFPYSITDERKSFAYFSDPVSETTTVFFYNNKKHVEPIEFDKLNELKPYSIVGVLGYFYTDTFKRERLNVKYVPTETKALELIFQQRYDLLPLSDFVGWSLIKRIYPSGFHTFSTCKKALSKDTLHLMVSRRYPNSRALIDRFNAALARIKRKGIYQKIISVHKPEMSVETP